jgi:hypothetical protein
LTELLQQAERSMLDDTVRFQQQQNVRARFRCCELSALPGAALRCALCSGARFSPCGLALVQTNELTYSPFKAMDVHLVITRPY